MTRVRWRILALIMATLAVAAGWFSLNGSRLARPSFDRLEQVALPQESPRLPPSETAAALAPPMAKALIGGVGGGGASVDLVTAEVVRDLSAPTARSVVAPSPIAPMPGDASLDDSRAVVEPFRVALNPTPPKHDQYFGIALLPEESRAPDPQGPPSENPAAGEAATAAAAEQPTAAAAADPARAPKPAPNPRAAEGAGSASETAESADEDDSGPNIDAPSGETAPAVAAAATTRGAEDPEASGPDGMILLGVFQGSGSSRALVRTATESAKQVVPGDEINGWRVSSIGEDHIRLRRASQTRLLKLPGAE